MSRKVKHLTSWLRGWQRNKRHTQVKSHSPLQLQLDLQQFPNGHIRQLWGFSGPHCPCQSCATMQCSSSSLCCVPVPFPAAALDQIVWSPGSPTGSAKPGLQSRQFVYEWWLWQANCNFFLFSLRQEVERFSCQASVRPHFSSLLGRVLLSAASVWL